VAATVPAAGETRLSPTLVELRSCDPGNAGPAPKAPKTSPFDVLAVRSQIIAGAEQAGLTLAVSTCAADRIIADAGADAVGALADVADDKDPRVTRVEAVGRRAGTSCARAAGLTR
jgi:tryptophan synthase beta subunit